LGIRGSLDRDEVLALRVARRRLRIGFRNRHFPGRAARPGRRDLAADVLQADARICRDPLVPMCGLANW